MDNKLNLNEFIKDNYESIKNGTYDWNSNDEAVRTIYKLAGKVVSNANINDLSRDDLLQELVFYTFKNAFKNIDYEKCSNATTYIYACMKFKLLQVMREMRKDNQNIKLEDKIKNQNDSDSLLIMDSLISNDPTPYENLLIEKNNVYYEILKDCIKEDELLTYYYLDGLSLRKIAPLYNMTFQNMSRRLKIQQDILMIKMIEKGAFELNDEINIDSLLKGDKKYSRYIYKNIQDKGLVDLLFNMDISIDDVTDALGVQRVAIRDLVNERINKKIKFIEDKGVNEGEVFVHLIINVKPELLCKIDTMDINFINQIIKKIKKDEELYNYLKKNKEKIISEKGLKNFNNKIFKKYASTLDSIKK